MQIDILREELGGNERRNREVRRDSNAVSSIKISHRDSIEQVGQGPGSIIKDQ